MYSWHHRKIMYVLKHMRTWAHMYNTEHFSIVNYVKRYETVKLNEVVNEITGSFTYLCL